LLSAYPPELRPIKPPEALGGAGGFSGSSFWKLTCARGDFALHAWPVDGPDAARLDQIHRWLKLCSDFPFLPIPEPTLDGRSFVSHAGRFWELTRWMPGRPSPISPLNRVHARLGFAAVARMHRRLERLSGIGSSPGIGSRLWELDTFLARSHAEYEDSLRGQPSGLEADLAARWLALARGQAPAVRRVLATVADRQTPLQPCVRDLRQTHLLFEGDELTGLIDFGAMDVDSVAGDLARLIGDWFPDDRKARTDALQTYESIRPLSTSEHTLLTAFEQANALLIGAHWLRWGFVERRSFEQPNALAEGLRKSLERMTDVLF